MSSKQQPITAYEEARHQLSMQAGYAARQRLFFEEEGRRKRGPPTPRMSAASTPLETTQGAAASSDQGLLSPVLLENHTAVATTAATLGIDINQQGRVEQWLEQPVASKKDVMAMITAFHKSVARPEMMGLVVQLESVMKTISDRLFTTQQELNFMQADNRAAQKHLSGLMLATTGWPPMMNPDQSVYMLGCMLSQVPEIVTWVRNRGHLAADQDHNSIEVPGFWFGVLQADPVTILQRDQWSGMTMLNFKSWDTRSAFLRRFGRQAGTPLYTGPTTPLGGHHVRASPCTPQWQRKLEVPLRVVISCINQHKETEGKKLVILWKSLTLMHRTKGISQLITPPMQDSFTKSPRAPL